MQESKQKLFPKYFFLELTNYCDLKCIMCTFHSEFAGKSRSKGFMDTDLAKRAIDEIAFNQPEKSWVALHGAGEPLLHKNLIDILKHASQYTNINHGFLTNGMQLSRDKILKILDSGVKWISVSIDGTDKTLFEKYRKGASYQKVTENMLMLSELAENYDIELSVNMTMQKEMEDQELEFVDKWIDKVDKINISPCKPLESRKSLVVDNNKLNRIPCYMIYETMTIFWDSNVALCCEDWFNNENLGSIKNNSLKEIFNNDKINRIRNLHETRKFDELKLCRDCDSWINNSPELIIDKENNLNIYKNAWQRVYTKRQND